MSANLPEPELYPLGVGGILVRFDKTLSMAANTRALQFRDRVQAADIAGVTEVASSLTSVRVEFDPGLTNRKTVTQAILALAKDNTTKGIGPKRLWHIPAAFSPTYAPQLGEAASLAGITVDQAIAQITGQTTRVIAIGFAPGQPYLGILPTHWDIPRQSSLTAGLPRGALITAVRQMMIWAADAPTGWRHVGQSAFRVYLPETDRPFAFEPGDAVQFHTVSDSAFRDIAADTDTNGGATCEVLHQ